MRADIFCRVVDNYGDIGVCWRLARRLAEGHHWNVRLWVDELQAFARIQPGIMTGMARQVFHGVDIVHWTSVAPEIEPGDVVIEAFACDPPATFVQAMQRQRDSGTGHPPIWINLEYLSAESWVEGCHGLPSQRADGLTKYFFFPGFTPATGGLLREPNLSAERDAFQRSRSHQDSFLRGLGLSESAMHHWQAGARLVSLFCYPHAPIAALVQALAHDARPSLMLVPEGVATDLEHIAAQQSSISTHAQVARVPFVSQPEFDRLLWCAELNFVRGEDSFVRAAWAARPLVWQIYPQDENTHLEKLEAWLARYPGPPEAQAVIRAWNVTVPATASAMTSEADSPPSSPVLSPISAQATGATASALSTTQIAATLATALQPPAWENWQNAARAWDAEQATRPDLGDSLAEFCAELSKKR